MMLNLALPSVDTFHWDVLSPSITIATNTTVIATPMDHGNVLLTKLKTTVLTIPRETSPDWTTWLPNVTFDFLKLVTSF